MACRQFGILRGYGMAEIRPFRGVRYNLGKVGDAGAVVAPPYDVIDGERQQRLYEAHPDNIVRVIQGREAPGDSATGNRYTRAAAAYRKWLAEGILQRDAEEGMYVYVQDFVDTASSDTVPKSRLGVVAQVKITPFGRGPIFPHEHTMPGPKLDRLELMRHTGAAFGQIFSLYSDPEKRVHDLLRPHLETSPLLAFSDEEKTQHRLWRVTDAETIRQISECLVHKPLFIADGHHRYETAVTYRDERAAAEGTDPQGYPYGYSMQTLVNMDDADGMAIGAIHRVVMDLGGGELMRLESGLHELFEEGSSRMDRPGEVLQDLRLRGEGDVPVFGFCTGRASGVRYLTLRSSVDLARLDPEGHSDAWRRLSSGLLQMVLRRVLGLDTEALTRGEKVRFIKSAAEAFRMVREAPDRAGFVLNPVGMDRLREVVLAGERMPPKSTFFYPKVYSGLVIQDMGEF